MTQQAQDNREGRMSHTVAVARIEVEALQYELIGHRGDWNWRCPGGQRAGYGAGGATQQAALRNLRVTLQNEEPQFTSLEWA